MGYTHYWDFNGRLDFKTLEQVEEVLNKYRSIIQLESNDSRRPVNTSDEIVFNGIGNNGHETFYLESNGNGFCKTNEKPYDIAVCEVLLILKHNYKEKFNLESDGFWVSKDNLALGRLSGKWNEAVENVRNQFGFEFEFMPVIDDGYYSFVIRA